MTLEETGLFLKTILKYQNWLELWDIGIIKFIRPRVKKQLDADNDKREQESKKRSEAWIEWNKKRRWEAKKSQKIAKHSKTSQPIASATKTSQLIPDNVNDNVNDNETVNDNINKEILPDGNNSGAENLPVYVPEDITIQINELIKEIKQTAQTLWIAYDKTKEREFAKHLLTAIEYGKFCENVWLDRLTTAINIMKASVIKNYRRWPTAWPKAIYQHYAEIYNLAKQATDKQEKNKVKEF
jgi:hypothetical protein